MYGYARRENVSARKDGEIKFPKQVSAVPASEADKAEIEKFVTKFCGLFGLDAKEILASDFTVVTPDSKNPYKQMYVAN